MAATDAVPTASSFFCGPGAFDPDPIQDSNEESMKIEVSSLSAFSSTFFKPPGLHQPDVWSYEPPSVWSELSWREVCRPEACSEQEYASPLAWLDATLPDDSKSLDTPKRQAATIVDSIEGISGESTEEEGYAMSGSTSEEDRFSPTCFEDHKEHIDVASVAQNGAVAGKALLALLKESEVEDHDSEGDHSSLDEMLLIRMEERECKESGADEKNNAFGADAGGGVPIVDVLAPGDRSRQSNVESDELNRVLPPAPKEFPPPPPPASIPHECNMVLPPGLPCGVSLESACSSIEPSPSLALPGSLESNSGSDADESDTEPLHTFSTSNNYDLLECTDEKPKDICSESDIACLSFRVEDTQKSSDEELVATRPCTRETSLPQANIVKSNVPKSCKHASEVLTNAAVGRTSGKKAQKTRGKTPAEPRRPRNKKPEVASEKLESPPASAVLRTTKDVDNTPGQWSWIQFVVLGFLFVVIVLLAKYQKQLFGTNGVQNGTTTVFLKGESHAWGTHFPIDAPAHARSQQVSSLVRNMDIDFARAKAVAADIKTKLNKNKNKNKRNGVTAMSKIKTQQEQIEIAQRLYESERALRIISGKDTGLDEAWKKVQDACGLH